MPLFLAETAAGTDSVSGVFAFLKTIFEFVITNMGTALDTITGTPLLFVPVIIVFAASIIGISVSVIRRLGVRGGGRRRRGR